MKKPRTHYDTLKVSQDAPLEVIRAAYKAMALKYHPDTNSKDPEALHKMKRINSAHEILSNPQQRAEYDTFLKSQNLWTKDDTPKHGARQESAGHEKKTASAPDSKKKYWFLCFAILYGIFRFSWSDGSSEQQDKTLQAVAQPQQEATQAQQNTAAKSVEQDEAEKAIWVARTNAPQKANGTQKQVCRPYTSEDGMTTGAACKQADGTWKIKTVVPMQK